MRIEIKRETEFSFIVKINNRIYIPVNKQMATYGRLAYIVAKWAQKQGIEKAKVKPVDSKVAVLLDELNYWLVRKKTKEAAVLLDVLERIHSPFKFE